MITNILFALGGGIAGFLVCALFCGGRTLELLDELEAAEAEADAEHAIAKSRWDELRASDAAHDRCADALETLRNQREEVRSICTGIKRVRAERVMEVIGD